MRIGFGENDSVSDMVPSTPKTVDVADKDDISEITTLVCHPSEAFVFCGNDNGSILVFETANAKQTQSLYNHARGVPITAMLWAPAQNFLISADASGRIKAYGLDRKGQHWDVKSPLLDTHLDHSINYLAVDSHKTSLLISSILPNYKSEEDDAHNGEQAEQISSLNLETMSTSGQAITSYKAVLPVPFSEFNPIPEFVQLIIGKTGNRLIFLDKSLWVCSLVANASRERYSRHFFIPDDWLNASQMLLSRITAQGDCVFARKDAVVVVKRGLRYEELFAPN